VQLQNSTTEFFITCFAPLPELQLLLVL